MVDVAVSTSVEVFVKVFVTVETAVEVFVIDVRIVVVVRAVTTEVARL